MPIVVVARQPRGIQTQHQPRLPEANLGDQPLEAAAAVARRTGLPKVVINDLNPFPWASRTRLHDRPADTAARCSPDADRLGRQSIGARKYRPAWRDAQSSPGFPN